MWVISVLFCRLCMSLCSYVLVVSGVCVSPQAALVFSFQTHTHTRTPFEQRALHFTRTCALFLLSIYDHFLSQRGF